jgi:hypothetical protein
MLIICVVFFSKIMSTHFNEFIAIQVAIKIGKNLFSKEGTEVYL